MNKETLCFALMAGGIMAALAAIAGLRLKRQMIAAGIATGAVIALLNMLVEFLGARLDVYYVSGPWMLVQTPIPLTVTWLFMTFVFIAGYTVVKRRAPRKSSVTLYMAAAIVAGWLTDYAFHRVGILTLGKNGSPAMIAAVWIIFVPLTIFLYELLMALMAGDRDAT